MNPSAANLPFFGGISCEIRSGSPDASKGYLDLYTNSRSSGSIGLYEFKCGYSWGILKNAGDVLLSWQECSGLGVLGSYFSMLEGSSLFLQVYKLGYPIKKLRETS